MLRSNRQRHPPHYNQMRHLVNELQTNPNAWAFLEPVNGDEVVDYYDVVKDPMGKSENMLYTLTNFISFFFPLFFLFLKDLKTLEQNVENDMYECMEDFIADVHLIFDNCRLYNGELSSFGKYADLVEKFFKERLQVWAN